MSAFGTKQTSQRDQTMSAFGGKADINGRQSGVHFQIIQTWTNPPSSPLSDPSQAQFVTWLNPHASLFGDTQRADIYRGYVLQHSNFFSVPHDAIVLFEVGLSSRSLVQGGGSTFARAISPMSIRRASSSAMKKPSSGTRIRARRSRARSH
jgi:hypothetical protein